jgi:hypothetical protein
VSDYIADLQRLSDLHKAGVLTAEEFTTQKAAILNGGKTTPPVAETAVGTPAVSDVNHEADQSLSPAWQTRFWFFDNYRNGSPDTRDHRVENLSPKEMFTVGINVYALIFGVFYLGYLGLWKRVAYVFVGSIVMLMVINADGRGSAGTVPIFVGIMAAITTNYGYWGKRRTGREPWGLLKY